MLPGKDLLRKKYAGVEEADVARGTIRRRRVYMRMRIVGKFPRASVDVLGVVMCWQ
jgi:hypothetical protein